MNEVFFPRDPFDVPLSTYIGELEGDRSSNAFEFCAMSDGEAAEKMRLVYRDLAWTLYCVEQGEKRLVGDELNSPHGEMGGFQSA